MVKQQESGLVAVAGIGHPANCKDKNESFYEVIYTDPFIVLSTLFKALERIDSIELKVMLMNDCVEMQKSMHLNEFGTLPGIKLTESFDPVLLQANIFTIIDKLEQAVSYLSMSGARFRALFSIWGFRTTLMWKVYGIDDMGKSWAYAKRQ